MDYYMLFEKLLRMATSMEEVEQFSVDSIAEALDEICALMRVSKVVIYFYENAKMELVGSGDELVCYDTGEPGMEVDSKRLVSEAMTVAVCKIYQPFNAKRWTDEERDRVDLILKTMLVFASRKKLKKIADRLTFYDSDGYQNTRFFIRTTQLMDINGELGGKATIQYNLRHFALVNQQIGRNAGDFIMRRFSDGLERILADKGILCRMGSDNFIVLCDMEVLNRVLQYLEGRNIEQDTIDGESIRITTTAGVYILPENFEYRDPGDIFDRLLAAARLAKGSGLEKVIFYSDDMEKKREKITEVQRLFREAIHNQEFQVYYQPKVDVNGSFLSGAEALCRWFHEGKLIAPDEFIPILEQGSEICTLDFYMLDHVCRDIRRWLDMGKEVVTVSVNLSRKHMMEPELVEHIIAILDKHKIPHKYVEIELTETTTDIEFRDIRRVVGGLQQAGIRTSVDDFGTGYSSLNLIREIPWDVLKVDKCFLPTEEDKDNSPENVMFKSVVNLAKDLGLECVVEGVETEAQLQALKDNNCDQAQGFFFDRPMPVEKFEERLSHKDYAE